MTRYKTLAVLWTILFMAIDLQATENDYVPPVKEQMAEVSPGKFMAFHQWDWSVDDPENISRKEKTRIEIPRDGGAIAWEGVEIPVVLREHKGSLFMVGYRRSTDQGHESIGETFRFFRSSKTTFVSIKSSEFPREIAIQNLWHSNKNELNATLNLDLTDSWFYHTITADIWKSLLSEERSEFASEKQLLSTYLKRYAPTKLQQIVWKPLQRKKGKGVLLVPCGR